MDPPIRRANNPSASSLNRARRASWNNGPPCTKEKSTGSNNRALGDDLESILVTAYFAVRLQSDLERRAEKQSVLLSVPSRLFAIASLLRRLAGPNSCRSRAEGRVLI